MEFRDVITQRRSVRTFADETVTDEQLAPLLEAARLAPSAHNHQSTQFIVVRDAERRAAVSGIKATADGKWINRWLTKAPAIIVACGDTSGLASHHGVDYWQLDAAIALEHIVLAAVDAGLGTCWVGVFDEQAVRESLGVPRQYAIVAMLAVGHPAKQMSGSERMTRAVVRGDARKPIESRVHYDSW